MDNISLYRKYRPHTFSDVLGQDHIIGVLENELENNKTTHAYLFAGPRGTGKTSVARILANSLGCSQEDLYEIDGASNRGIDEIRELKENIKTLPFRGDKKVYVIDEVHMLTKEAFNALLKTLEEPPHYAVFILATTELHKVPDTIISRCQLFIFKKPTEFVLKKMVRNIAEKEGKELDDGATTLIAFLGDGSFRDTHTVLEQVMHISGGKKITQEEVAKTTGAPQKELIHNFIDAILEMDLEKGINTIHTAKTQNIDIKIYLRLVLKHLRFATLIVLSQNTKTFIEMEVGEDELVYLENIGKHKNKKILIPALKSLIDVYPKIGKSYIEELPIELALAEIITHNNEEA